MSLGVPLAAKPRTDLNLVLGSEAGVGGETRRALSIRPGLESDVGEEVRAARRGRQEVVFARDE